jgi:hypothetical protein
VSRLRRLWLIAANEVLWRIFIRVYARAELLYRWADDIAHGALWRRDHAAGGEAARRWSS